MIIEIAGEEYELNFGWGFQDYLDITDPLEFKMQGVNLGLDTFGLEKTVMAVSTGNPRHVRRIMKAGLSESKKQPKNEDLKAFIDEKARVNIDKTTDETPLDDFIEELLEEIKKEPSSQYRLEKVLEQ